MYQAWERAGIRIKIKPWNFGGRDNLRDLDIDGKMRYEFIIVINETAREKMEMIHLVQYRTYDDL
jgi:hypothetical protein